MKNAQPLGFAERGDMLREEAEPIPARVIHCLW